MDQVFENQNLEGAGFYGVNLGGAVFDGVNLAGATIRDANLADVSIEAANIKGMTVLGFRVDQLIDAEQDRRDQTRRRLRINDLCDPAAVAAVMAELEVLRAAFRATLRRTDHARLCKRPTKATWSAIEHVRHLVFAEDLYINRWILANDEPWCGLGALPAFLKGRPRFADVGSAPTEDLEAVLAAWDEIHARTQAFVSGATGDDLARDTSKADFGQGTVGNVLQGLAHHDLHHIRKAEAAIAKAT